MNNQNLASKMIIGMVHCKALPTTSGFNGHYTEIIEAAVEDAKTLEKAGVHAIIVENMGDTPFSAALNKAQVAALAMVTYAVKQNIHIPIGIDAAFNDYEASLSIAAMANADFVRIPVFVDTVVFTDGIIYPCAKACLEYRKQLGRSDIKIFADIQVKHAHMLLPYIDIVQSAKEARDCGADAIIVTGSQIGEETPIDMIKRVKEAIDLPVFAGSGVSRKNMNEQLKIVDGAIIGSGFKEDGNISNPISYALAKEFMDQVL